MLLHCGAVGKANMNKRILVGSIATLSALLGFGQAPAQQRPAAKPAAPTISPRAVIDQYCLGCHNEKSKVAGLALDKVDLSRPGDSAEVLEKVVRKLRAGRMPPLGMRRPDPATYEALTVELENEIDRAAASKPYLVRPGIHRV